jgi:hypothetical protein
MYLSAEVKSTAKLHALLLLINACSLAVLFTSADKRMQLSRTLYLLHAFISRSKEYGSAAYVYQQK